MATPRDVHPRKALGVPLQVRIKQSKVLMVGAGGIGCELLKNLVLTGFGEIHIVDLDTIDLSNLNRQFLFGMQHIKKSKAMVAKETAGKFNPHVKLIAHHANIKDAEFNVAWYKEFDLVFNALDNLDARRHVNKMCLAADKPLVESGTTGFNGQVQVIRKGKTECYDCTPKPVPKSYPVCTIRSTPSQPIHCIVWAKSYLFTEIFGTSEDDSPELDHSADSENAREIESLRRESQELKRIREQIGTESFSRSVFDKVYTRDINRLRGMEDMWKSRKPPEALDYEKVTKDASSVKSKIAAHDQKIWTLEENYAVFADSLERLSKRVIELQAQAQKDGTAQPVLSFDKDDVDTLDFVAAAANLRSYVFGIELRSKFDIKQIAGNIIPAIATTNAIVAGICVLQAFKVFRDDLDAARMVFLSRSDERVFTATALSPPDPTCEICGVARLTLELDLSRATMRDLVDGWLREKVGYGEEISVLNEKALLYDIDFDDNLDEKLRDIGITDGVFVTVLDDEEVDEDVMEEDDKEGGRPRVNLVLAVVDRPIPADQPPIMDPPADFSIPPRLKQKVEQPTPEKTVPTSATAASVPTGVKRHRDDNDVSLSPKKRKLDDATAALSIRENRSVDGVNGQVEQENGKIKGKEKEQTQTQTLGGVEVVVLDDDGVIELD